MASTIRSPLHYPSGHTKLGRCRTDVDTTSHSNNVGATLPGCRVASSCLTYISLWKQNYLFRQEITFGRRELSRVNVEAFRWRPLTKKKKKKKKKREKKRKKKEEKGNHLYMSNYICMKHKMILVKMMTPFRFK